MDHKSVDSQLRSQTDELHRNKGLLREQLREKLVISKSLAVVLPFSSVSVSMFNFFKVAMT